MFAQQRLQNIAKMVEEERTISFKRLQTALGIPPATLRRDLGALERQRKLIRTHGGAMHPSAAREQEGLLSISSEGKGAIARAANLRIPNGATVFVDSGQTCLECGKLLLSRPSIRILTNSFPLLALSMDAEARVIALGGELRRTCGAFLGVLSETWIGKLRADYVLMGASGLDGKTGAGVTDFHDAALKEQILLRGEQRYLLAESSKLEKPAGLYYATWKDFDLWITDREPPEKMRDVDMLSVL